MRLAIHIWLVLALLLLATQGSFRAWAAGANPATDDPVSASERRRLAREYFLRRRTHTDGTPATIEERQRGLQALRRLPISPVHAAKIKGRISPQSSGLPTPSIGNAWQFIGPKPIKDDFINNGAGQYGFGDASGRVSAIAIHPYDASVVLIGGFAGLARTSDGGQTWNFVIDSLPSQAISSLAWDAAGSQNIAYAGTGDAYYDSDSFSSLYGVGIYRSTDKGLTWQQFGKEMSGCVVAKIVVDPNSNGLATGTTVYAALQGNNAGSCNGQNGTPNPGVWKSVDSGQTWISVASNNNLGNNPGNNPIWGFDLAIDSYGSLYAATSNGLYKSNNSGNSWIGPLGLGAFPPLAATYNRTSVSASRYDRSNSPATLPTVLYSNGSNSGTVWKSLDGGVTFARLPTADGFCKSGSNDQCFYDQYVALDYRQINLSIIYLGGIEPFRSIDGGANFASYAPVGNYAGTPKIHGDNHAIDFANQPQQSPYAIAGNPFPIYIGNDGGVYKSIDDGVTWSNMNANLPGGFFIGISASDDGTVVGGVQDNGGIKKNPGDATAWHVIRGGDGGNNKVDSINSSRIYTTYVTGSGKVAASLLQYSFNGGSDYTAITPPNAVGNETASFYSPVWMARNDASHVLFGAQNVYRSYDSGNSWTQIGNLRATSGGNLEAVAEAPNNSNVVYASDGSNKSMYVTYSANLGASATWNLRVGGLPGGQDITAIAISQDDSNTAYVTLAQFGTAAAPRRHIFKTTNGGVSWFASDAGLPDVPFNDIIISPWWSNILFAASDVGVFNSMDSGRTWSRSNIGMPEGQIANALYYNRTNDLLYAGSYGRGAYVLNAPPRYMPMVQNLRSAGQTLSSITWAWDALAGATGYGLYDPAAPTVLIASTSATAFTMSNLQPNRVYSVVVTASNGLIESDNSLSISARTAPQQPSGTQGSAPGPGSWTLTWANGNSPANPSGTVYQAQISADPNFGAGTISSISGVDLLSATFSVQTNQNYYGRVNAINNLGVASAFDQTVRVWIPAAAPSPLAASSVNASSITAIWASASNFPATSYEVQISTDHFATINSGASVQGFSYAFTGLNLGALYYFRVRAVSSDNSKTSYVELPAAVTHGPQALPPHAYPPSIGTFYAVGVSSIGARWGDAACVGTCYAPLDTVEISTDPALGTINQRFQTIFGYAGFGDINLDPPALLANTTYYFRVQTTVPGHPEFNSDFVSLSSMTTLAARPTAIQPSSMINADFQSVTVAWSSGTAAGYNNGNTVYNVQVSTDPAFASVTAATFTAPGQFQFAAFDGLLPNTTYYARVSAYSNHDQAWTAFTNLGLTATRTVAPGVASQPYTNVSSNSVTVTWTAGYTSGGFPVNPPGTSYRVDLLDDNTVGTATPWDCVINTTQLSVVFDSRSCSNLGGLAPNRIYTASVVPYSLNLADFDWHNRTPFGTVITLANPPVAAPPIVYFSSITLPWIAGDASGASFLAQISTDSFATINASLGLPSAESSATFQQLTGNTIYSVRVAAVNAFAGVPSAFSAAPPVATPLAAPSQFPSPYPPTPNSLSLFLGPDGNGPSTRYEVQASTSPDFATIYSSITFAPLVTITGLPVNKSFFVRLRSLGNNASASPFVAVPPDFPLITTPAPPGSLPFAAIRVSSITAAWTSNGNSIDTLYRAEISTDAFATVNLASSTLGGLTLTFGSGGAGPDLSPDTTYYFRVRASSGNAGVFGGPPHSDFTSLGAAVTLPLPPTATTVLLVSSSTVALSWQPSGNPAVTTLYEIWSALDLAFTQGVSKLVANASPFSYPGLAANTKYFLRIRVLGPSGQASDFDAVVSTQTLPPAPAPPGAPSGLALGVSSITWTWPLVGDAKSYRVYQASSPSTLIGAVAAPPFLNLGLASNTVYNIVVTGLNSSGEGVASSSATAYTLAAAPSGVAVPGGGLFSSSATITWLSNGNPDATQASIDLSTYAAFDVANSSMVAATSYAASKLLGCTKYYARVRNKSGGGAFTDYAEPISFTTLSTVPQSPIGLTAIALAQNRMQLSWLQSPTEGIMVYNLYYDNGTGTIDYTKPLVVNPPTASSVTAGPFTNGVAYKFALRALHRCGVDDGGTTIAVAISQMVLPSIRAYVTYPRSGTRVSAFTTNLSLAAESGGAYSGVKQVLYQYKPSNSATWLNVPAASARFHNPATAFPYSMSWNISPLAWGNYDLRAVAYDVFGSSDPNPSAITISLGNHRGARVWGWNTVSGELQHNEAVYNSVTNTVASADATSDGTPRQIALQLPSGSLSNDDATVSIIPNPAPQNIPAIPADLGTSAGIATNISLTGATLTTTARITMSYSDVGNTGIIDGTNISVKNARILSNDGNGGPWKADIATTVDSVNHTITGVTSHFSIFAIVGLGAASNLDNVRVYPVPYKPNGSNSDEGHPFNAADPNSGILFDNLPQSATIKIYTISGQLVAQKTADTTGKLQWDARNDSGRDVASGGYVAVISSPGSGSIAKKLLVLR